MDTNGLLAEFFEIRNRYHRELGDAFLCNTWESIRMSDEQREATRQWVEQRRPTLDLKKYESEYYGARERLQKARN